MGMINPNIISNEDLTLEDLPSDDADFEALFAFSITYTPNPDRPLIMGCNSNGEPSITDVEKFMELLAWKAKKEKETIDRLKRDYFSAGKWPESLEDLRFCLLRSKLIGIKYRAEVMSIIHKIRDLLISRDQDAQ
jgi:hypothetical protein